MNATTSEYTKSDYRNGIWIDDVSGNRLTQGRREGSGWQRTETRAVKYGTVSRATKYYATEDDLFAAIEAGKLQWGRWA